ncbi:hypothetical protein BVRB_6g141480 [Beta vulgaris subsp. vulgaris]|nr:hypothetical protein BVRB_6g141480 [Beta vulgaris subsp. vulgaris]
MLSQKILSTQRIGLAKWCDGPTRGLMSPSYENPEFGIQMLRHFWLSVEPLGLAKWGDRPIRGLTSPSDEDPELALAERRLGPTMAERFMNSVALAANVMAELDAETMSIPPPPKKRSWVDQYRSNVPFTSITRPHKLARVNSAVKGICIDADDEVLLNLGHGEVNNLYEFWLEVRLTDAEKRAKGLRHELQKARSQFEKGQLEFWKAWKRSLEGLAFIRKMATNSYRMVVRETKERLKGILAGPDSSLTATIAKLNSIVALLSSRSNSRKRRPTQKMWLQLLLPSAWCHPSACQS